MSLWLGKHTMKLGASITYDVTKQLYQPLQNGVYTFNGNPTQFPNPSQYRQSFALVPEAALMYPKATVLSGFFQEDWRARSNLTLNLGLRYDVELIKDIPDWPAGTDANNFDPRVGFNWDPLSDQKWSVRGGFGRFTQQHPIFTIVKGGVSGRNGQVVLSLTPADALFPTFPNSLPAFPPGAVLPARDIQEISPDLENEFAWAGNVAIQRQIGSRASVEIAANINRGQKHGFLDVNQAAPIDKAALNAAMAAAPLTTVFRTTAQADATRPNVPVPNAFRRMDVLTNEGRSWYQGVRASSRYQSADLTLTASYTLSKSEDRLNHWFAPEDSSDPELDRGRTGADTPHNFVASATWDLPGRQHLPRRLAPERRAALAERHALLDSLHRLPDRHRLSASAATAAARRPGRARATPSAARSSTTPTSRCRARSRSRDDRLEFRADAFNAVQQLEPDLRRLRRHRRRANFGQHTGGSAVFPGRQFQFAATYRF